MGIYQVRSLTFTLLYLANLSLVHSGPTTLTYYFLKHAIHEFVMGSFPCLFPLIVSSSPRYLRVTHSLISFNDFIQNQHLIEAFSELQLPPPPHLFGISFHFFPNLLSSLLYFTLLIMLYKIYFACFFCLVSKPFIRAGICVWIIHGYISMGLIGTSD